MNATKEQIEAFLKDINEVVARHGIWIHLNYYGSRLELVDGVARYEYEPTEDYNFLKHEVQ